MKLTDNFSLEEMVRSELAARRGIRLDPPEAVVANLKRLCVQVLQPLRDALNAPIVITSGFRPLWLNTMVGGSVESAHLDGRAADFRVPGFSNNDVFLTIQDLKLPIDQCITEFPPHGWIHVSVPPLERRPRNEYLATLYVGGRVVYQTVTAKG